MIYLVFIPIIGPILALFIGPYLLLKRSRVYDFILVMIFGRLANPVMYSYIENYSVIWWISIYSSLVISLLFKQRKNNTEINKGTRFFVILIFVFTISSSFSLNSFLSLFKLLNWVILTILFILNSKYFNYDTKNISKFLYALIITSVLTLPYPFIAYARDGQGFQGVFNHPQAFAVFVAVLSVFLIDRATKLKSLRNKKNYFFLFIIIILIYLTKARTGFLILTSIFLTTFLELIYNFTTLRLHKLKKIFPKILKITGLLILLVLLSGLFLDQDKLKLFVLKKDEKTTLSESFEKSRGFIILQQWNNFTKEPMLGIGFGIAKSDTHEQEIQTFNGIPISAATEKANLPLTLLEETGVIGLLAFIPLFFFVTKNIGDEKFLWIGFIVSNFSEVTFFSYGSFGLIAGVLIAKTITLKK